MPLDLWLLIRKGDFFDHWATIEVSLFSRRRWRAMGSPRGFSKVSTIGRDVIVGPLLDPSLMLFVGGGGSPGSHTGFHAQIYFSSSFFFSARLWPPDFLSLPPGPFGGGSLNLRFRCHTSMFTVRSLSSISSSFSYRSRS
ncbi:hypothetical protein MA16_Dca012321 [Dendrobium catenatum]|uniref:Uncharacterized protein n=1 Tax=Dendrobium catenatum TaxID=906689 RepID=A0A2I0WRC8_9ASPA|nr:hypothetical protein MA16_Dca012321 [Dendrobium catenatum]